MYEHGEPSSTLKGLYRTELEGSGGKTVLIYQDEKMVIIIPDSVDFTSLDVILKIRDLNLNARDITIECENMNITANKININADVTITGNFTTQDGITRLN